MLSLEINTEACKKPGWMRMSGEQLCSFTMSVAAADDDVIVNVSLVGLGLELPQMNQSLSWCLVFKLRTLQCT